MKRFVDEFISNTGLSILADRTIHASSNLRVLQSLLSIAIFLVLLIAPNEKVHAQTERASLSDATILVGDQIEFSLVGFPSVREMSQVEINGRILFPYVGSLQASGKTIEELKSEVQLSLAGTTTSIMQPNGEIRQISLAGVEVYLRVVQRAPVFVGGSVTIPGAVQFHTGMTVRHAIALAGGIQSVLNEEMSQAQIIQLSSDLRSARTRRSILLVEYWATQALAENDPNMEPIQRPLDLSEEQFNQLVQAHRDRIKRRIATLEDEVSFNQASSDALAERVRLMEDQLVLASSHASKLEETYEELNSLSERGLLTTDRLSRLQTQLSDAQTLMLSAQGTLISANVSILRSDRDIRTQRAEIAIAAINERAEIVASLLEVEERISNLTRTLALADPESSQELDLITSIWRNGKLLNSTESQPDSRLLPGDYVSVDLYVEDND